MDARLIGCGDSPRRLNLEFVWHGRPIAWALAVCVLMLGAGASEASQEMSARQTNPDACLDLLQSAKTYEVIGGLRLGRVFWDGEVLEPVLIRHTDGDGGPKFSFRNCSGGLPIDVNVAERDLELFNSALVAHFVPARTEALTMYREVPFLGFAPKGEAELAFRGAGGMLEARRLDDVHVELTGTDSVRIFPLGGTLEREKVAILLVASRAAMRGMGPDVWEDSWGDSPEDSKIEREIIWWELVGGGRVKAHRAVANFTELAGQLAAQDNGAEEDSNDLARKSLKSILNRAALAILLAEDSEHIELAETMIRLASTSDSDAALDVATLEERWSKQQHAQLEQAASRGRYWMLTRLYDLAAIMPDRIAGKVRRNYYQSVIRLSATGAVDARFAKDYVTLAKDAQIFHVANAVFQDQAAGMASVMNFMGCLLEDVGETTGGRFEALEEGLEMLGLSAENLGDMDVRKAFQYLFQGFSLPAGLRAGERSFLGSIGNGDPEVLQLVRSLQSSFETTALDARAACEVALIPDDLLLGQPIEDTGVMVVASMPTPGLTPTATTVIADAGSVTQSFESPATSDRTSPTTIGSSPATPVVEPPIAPSSPTQETPPPASSPVIADSPPPVIIASVDPLYTQARLASREARAALAKAIEFKGSRHTRKKIQKGNVLLDRGTSGLTSQSDKAALSAAIRDLEAAKKIYLEAQETSWRKEHSKPKLRVH